MAVQGARIEPYRPPQIGEKQQVDDHYHRHHRIKMIALACLLMLGSTIVGAVIGGGVGALMGLGISVGIVAIRCVGAPVFHFFFPNLHHIFLDWDQKIDQTGPPLGKYIRSDLLIEHDGTKSYEMKLAMLKSAQKSILLSPCFAGGEYWQQALDIMQERLEVCLDLKVTILVMSDLLTDQDTARLKALQEQYPDRFHMLISGRIPHLDPYLHSTENHTKILVVDDLYFSVGGSPIDERGACLEARKKVKDNLAGRIFKELMPKKFRDADGFGKGEIAKTLRDQFFRLYAIWEYRTTGKKEWLHYAAGEIETVCPEFENHPKKCPGVKTKVLVSGPEHRGHNPIVHEMMGMIDSAEEGAYVAGLYFTPDKEFKDVLIQKKKQGIEVHGYFGSDEVGFAQKITYKINRFGLQFFSKVHLFSDPTFYYHKKVGTVDGKKGWFGSCNLGGKSIRCDHELVIFFESKRIANQIDQGFREDRQKANPMKQNTYHYFARAIGNFINTVIGQVAF